MWLYTHLKISSTDKLATFCHFQESIFLIWRYFQYDRFKNLCISVPWWKGNWILILGLYFFTSRQTFYKRKWHEKREILFCPPKSGIPNFSYIFKTVHISEKLLWFSWSAPYFCLRKAGDNWKVALKCKNTQSYLPLILQKITFSP